jgi:hypothetical protein
VLTPSGRSASIVSVDAIDGEIQALVVWPDGESARFLTKHLRQLTR